jgi:hypothetical protein
MVSWMHILERALFPGVSLDTSDYLAHPSTASTPRGRDKHYSTSRHDIDSIEIKITDHEA